QPGGTRFLRIPPRDLTGAETGGTLRLAGELERIPLALSRRLEFRRHAGELRRSAAKRAAFRSRTCRLHFSGESHFEPRRNHHKSVRGREKMMSGRYMNLFRVPALAGPVRLR